jgi:hypothetical protein
MAIDIRATVTCSLGTLISGSISDDYLQGSGLVKTRGTCEISGLITPAMGTVVTFSYTKGGVTRFIPRKVRVLSSFADPFRRTTKVELGCLLTYLSDYKPAPTVDGEPPLETGKRQQCLNGYFEFSNNSAYGVPIDAKMLLDTCLERLGITASSNPLTNRFYRESFDLSPGYVSVINDLLLSESYFGYLSFDEVLQITTFDEAGGTGPVFTKEEIIDIAPIGVGQLPGEAVVVRYDAMQLKEDKEGELVVTEETRNWESEEVIPSVETVEVRATDSDGDTRSFFWRYIPHSKTTTQYGEDESWDDNVCVIYSTGEGLDLSNSVIKRTTRQKVLLAKEANDYCAQLLSNGFSVNGGRSGEVVTIEDYEYDEKGQVIRRTTSTYEPFFMWAGRLNVEFIYGNSAPALGQGDLTGQVLTRKVVEETTTLYADLPLYIVLKAGETIEKLVNGQKVVTSLYENWALTQQGQQAIAGSRTTSPFNTAEELVEFLIYQSNNLILVGNTVQTSSNRIVRGMERRPSPQKRLGLSGNNAEQEVKAQLEYSMGSPLGPRIIEFSMPLQSDDYYSTTGAIVKGDAAAKANRFGRVQNRLLLGNRSGINLQVAPERMPVAPFDPIFVQAAGLTSLYRANGNQWAFDSNGIVCSTDALYWGVAGKNS